MANNYQHILSQAKQLKSFADKVNLSKNAVSSTVKIALAKYKEEGMNSKTLADIEAEMEQAIQKAEKGDISQMEVDDYFNNLREKYADKGFK